MQAPKRPPSARSGFMASCTDLQRAKWRATRFCTSSSSCAGCSNYSNLPAVVTAADPNNSIRAYHMRCREHSSVIWWLGRELLEDNKQVPDDQDTNLRHALGKAVKGIKAHPCRICNEQVLKDVNGVGPAFIKAGLRGACCCQCFCSNSARLACNFVSR